jgi:hypothetical protein
MQLSESGPKNWNRFRRGGYLQADVKNKDFIWRGTASDTLSGKPEERCLRDVEQGGLACRK